MFRHPREWATRSKAVLTVLACGLGAAALLLVWTGTEDYQDAMSVPYVPGAVPPSYDPVMYLDGSPWFEPAVAEALSDELDRAIGGADLCIGWDIDENGQRSYGSNQGVGQPANACARWVVVAVVTRYVPESSESSDRAGLEVFASDAELEAALTAATGLTDGAEHRALLGDDGDLATANVVAGVPMALASAGLLEPVALVAVDGDDGPAGAEGATGAELGDHEGEDGNEALHQNGRQLRAGLAILVVALSAAIALVISRPRSRPQRSAGGPPASPRAALRARQGAADRPPAPIPGGGEPAGPTTPVPPTPEHHP